jgi:hypothetical protein
VVSAAGGEPRLVTPAGGDYPSWSRDGAWIAYTVWTEDDDPRQGTWVVPAAGGEPRLVDRAPTPTAWTPGGELVQLRREEGRLRVWRARPPAFRFAPGPLVALGAPLGPHAEHLPITVDPRTGRVTVVRRTYQSELLVFDRLDRRRW